MAVYKTEKMESFGLNLLITDYTTLATNFSPWASNPFTSYQD